MSTFRQWANDLYTNLGGPAPYPQETRDRAVALESEACRLHRTLCTEIRGLEDELRRMRARAGILEDDIAQLGNIRRGEWAITLSSKTILSKELENKLMPRGLK